MIVQVILLAFLPSWSVLLTLCFMFIFFKFSNITLLAVTFIRTWRCLHGYFFCGVSVPVWSVYEPSEATSCFWKSLFSTLFLFTGMRRHIISDKNSFPFLSTVYNFKNPAEGTNSVKNHHWKFLCLSPYFRGFCTLLHSTMTVSHRVSCGFSNGNNFNLWLPEIL